MKAVVSQNTKPISCKHLRLSPLFFLTFKLVIGKTDNDIETDKLKGGMFWT